MLVLLGSEGSMGKRYQAILKSLNIEHTCFDKDPDMNALNKACRHSRYAIIATPTETHTQLIEYLVENRIPEILCEKPICKDIDELKKNYAKVMEYGSRLTMMFQYSLMANERTIGDTYYDYFRHGKDTLAWDCIQIIGLARGAVWLSNKSPTWRCLINGKPLGLNMMDKAYVKFVENWLNGKVNQDPRQIIAMHEKALCFTEDENEANKGYCGYPGKIYVKPVPGKDT